MSIARIVSLSFTFFLEKIKEQIKNHILKLINNELESLQVFATSSTCVP